MATGFEQARSVVAAIAGDLEAADRVELDLPETGVCGIGPSDDAGADGACCGTAPATLSTVATATAAAAPSAAGKCGAKSCANSAPAPAAAQSTRCCG
jgi:hypothetical protein